MKKFLEYFQKNFLEKFTKASLEGFYEDYLEGLLQKSRRNFYEGILERFFFFFKEISWGILREILREIYIKSLEGAWEKFPVLLQEFHDEFCQNFLLIFSFIFLLKFFKQILKWFNSRNLSNFSSEIVFVDFFSRLAWKFSGVKNLSKVSRNLFSNNRQSSISRALKNNLQQQIVYFFQVI